MTERLADVVERIDNMRQLNAVLTAMRGIAAAHTQQSRDLLKAIEAYTDAISQAISRALTFTPAPAQRHSVDPEKRGLVLFCAEQGFAGAFTDRILDSAAQEIGSGFRSAKLLLIGTRGAAIAAERGLSSVWQTSMANQVGNVTDVAERVVAELYARIAKGEIVQVDVFFSRADPSHTLLVKHVRLLPVERETFRIPAMPILPLTTIKPEILLACLIQEYIFAKLCEAAMHSLAAENEARMQSMSAATDNIDRTLRDLTQRENAVRQEEVTAEIVELAAGVEARNGNHR